MKTKVLALAVALAMPASAKGATLAVPLYYTWTVSVPGNNTPTGFCCGAGGVVADITWNHLGTTTIRTLVGSYTTEVWGNSIPPQYILKTFGDGQSVTFEMLDDTDTFSDIRRGLHNGGVSILLTISTPLPAALPLFAAGLGIVTFLARRRKTGAGSPAATTGRTSL
jgi:hypothetical protein